MNCRECGGLVEPDAKFCPKCFARIEPPGFWQRFFALFKGAGKPGRPIVQLKKTITIKTTDKDGLHHEYHSLDEVPPEMREEIQKLEKEALKETLSSSSSAGLISEIITKKTASISKSASIFKIKDASGTERVYHSLDEVPAEIRAAIEQARNKAKD